MPIKVTYQDEKGNPIEDAPRTSERITSADKDRWEEMQGEAFQKGVYEDDFINLTPNGLALLEKYDIPLSKVKEHLEYTKEKIEKQEAHSDAIPEVADRDERSRYMNDDAGPRVRYFHYVLQQGDNPPEDYGTDIDRYLDALDKKKQKEDAQWAGFNDANAAPNQYQSPTVVNGQLVQPAGFYPIPAPVEQIAPAPDPRFPTRDPITGRVTQAIISNQAPNLEVSDTTDDEE